MPRAREDQRERGIRRPRKSCRGARRRAGVWRAPSGGLACGNRHRRAGVRRGGGVRDAGLDIERVEAAGLLQRVQAGIAHLRPGTRGWHRAGGRADRSGRRPAAGRAAPCRAWLRRAPAVRARSAIPVTRRLLVGRRFDLPARAHPRRAALRRPPCRSIAMTACVTAAGLVLEPRRQLPREFVEGVVFDRRQRRRLGFAGRTERQHVLRRFLESAGISVDVLGRIHGVSRSVWCEVSDAYRFRQFRRRQAMPTSGLRRRLCCSCGHLGNARSVASPADGICSWALRRAGRRTTSADCGTGGPPKNS